MARPYPSIINRPKGELYIEDAGNKILQVYFTPPLELLGNLAQESKLPNWHIADLDLEAKNFTIFPFKIASTGIRQPRHYKLGRITVDISLPDDYIPIEDDVEAMLQMEFPKAFTEDYNFGLGFRKEYRHIVNLLEIIGIEHLYIKNFSPTLIDIGRKEATFKKSDLDMITSRLDKITDKARSVANDLKDKAVGELMTQILQQQPSVANNAGLKAEIANLMKQTRRFSEGGASNEEEKEAIQVIKINSQKILRDHPGELAKLRNDIEAVTLKELIKRFEDMLEQDLPESRWQKMFEENPFILSMAFGTPVVKIQDQAYIGGRKISGSGERITDFLYKNIKTNNAAVVEIKKPGSKLLNARPYRNNLYAPSSDLVAAVNQVLDQIYNFGKNIAPIKENSRIDELETYSIFGFLIIGRSLEDADQHKSFELFRGNSKNIQIITFDELLSKLTLLLDFLSPGNPPASGWTAVPEDGAMGDLPF